MIACVVALCNFIIAISVVFIPPNTTGLVQPLDQIIINVKAAYARKTFILLNAATDTYEEIATMEEKCVDNTTTHTAGPRV